MVLGDCNTGKSQIVNRLSDDKFEVVYFPTIGIDFKVRTININNSIYKLQYWDTAGQ